MNNFLENILDLAKSFFNAKYCFVIHKIENEFRFLGNSKDFSEDEARLISEKILSSINDSPSFEINGNEIYFQNFILHSTKYFFVSVFEDSYTLENKNKLNVITNLIKDYFDDGKNNLMSIDYNTSIEKEIETDIKLKLGPLKSAYFTFAGAHKFNVDSSFANSLDVNPDLFNKPENFISNIYFEDQNKFNYLLEEFKQGKQATAEFRIVNNTGKIKHLKISGIPVQNEDLICGIIFDTTKEKDLFDRLKVYDEKFRLLIETANDFIFNLDSAGYFVSVNNYGALALGYKPEEMIGKHFLEFIDDSLKSDIALAFQNVLKADKIDSFETAFLDRFGKSIIFEIQARPIKSDNKIKGLLGIGRDITKRRQDENKLRDLNSKLVEANRIISIERDRAKQQISVLEEVNKLKSDFISNISHELRTPLASIVGFSETIISDLDMPKEMVIEFNNIILSEGKKLAKIINDLLDFARYEDGKVDIFKSEFDAIELVKEIVDQAKDAANKKGVILTANIFDDSVIINADRDKIEQVYQNLISNAIKFTNKGGRVTIIAQGLAKEFEVIVSDTGIGIPEKDINNIFQKLYKVIRPGTQIPGIGLGLGLSKQIIDLHKGLITVQSEVNKGSTFVVKLPLNYI